MIRGLLLAAAASAIVGGATAGQAASPPLIVFSANRAPSVSGEIYRIDANGRRVDLSRSPYQDQGPVVSPDGKRVAFQSDRSGEQAVYEVGIDGRGLARLGGDSLKSINDFNEFAWQPHGRRLAVLTDTGDWIVQRGRKPVHLPRMYGISGWSPDGRVLAVTASVTSLTGTRNKREDVHAVSPSGRRLWTIQNAGAGTWSAHGLLAVPTGPGDSGSRHGIAVYDEEGRLQFKARLGRLAVAQAFRPWWAWSPDASRLAFVSGRSLQVRTAMGRVLLRKQVPDEWSALIWNGNGRVVGYGSCGCRIKGVDIRTGKIAPASSRFVLQAASGKFAVLTPPSGSGFAIQVAPRAGGPPKTYGHVAGCDGGGGWTANASSFQFVPGRHSLVYVSDCQPTADLYSVSPSGGAPHRITSPRSNHAAPALSATGDEVAYSWLQCVPLCSSGSTGIRIVGVDGSGDRVVTSTATCPPQQYGPVETPVTGDFAPSWSPDAKTIVFSRQGCNAPDELYTVSAHGGAEQDLGIAGRQPAWGPSRIAYVVGPYVWTVDPDGTDPVLVGGGLSYSPAWSPDGRLTYLWGSRHGSYPTFYGNTLVVGSTHTTLPFAAVSSVGWSPDGTRLVVTAQRTKTAPFDVYTVKPDGADPVRLTENYGASSASW